MIVTEETGAFMQIYNFDLYDKVRQRKVPIIVYLPTTHSAQLPVVIFNPGYQGQEELLTEKLVYSNYCYLAEYFTNKHYAFITIQHDILGDDDGLETIDPDAIQDSARKHLYIRGEENILFVLKELRNKKIPIPLDKFIIGGHSNGGDIAKYFINNNPYLVNALVLLDARRAFLRPQHPVKVLMFEADDTTTDDEVIALPIQGNNDMRSNTDLIIVKPQHALHQSYSDDYITSSLKARIYRCLDMFLEL